MARLFKRGEVWWAVGHDSEGRRWRRSTRQTSKRAAERVARALELENAVPPQVRPLPLGEALDLAWGEMTLRGNAASTMEVARTRGAHLVRILGGETDVHELGAQDVNLYLRTRRSECVRFGGKRISDHTIAKELGLLGLGLRTARRHGLFHGEPKAVWPDALRQVYTPRDRWLTVDEYAAVLEQATPHRRDWITAYVFTGARHMELHGVRKDRHVDLEGRRIFVPGTKTRAAARWVPLSVDALEVVTKRMRSPGPMLFEPVWRRGRMHADLKRWCSRAGVEPVSANDLRRTFASWMAGAGVSDLITARLMGHTSSTMVRRVYAQLSESSLRGAVDALPTVANTCQDSAARVRK